MRRIACWVLCSGVLGLAGCVRELPSSVNGLADPEGSNQVFDPALVGDWYDSKWSHVAWRVARDGDTKNYLITQVSSDGKEKRYTGCQVELGGRRFLDLKTIPAGFFEPEAVHAFFRVKISSAFEFGSGTAFTRDEINKAKVFNGSKFRRYHTLDVEILDQAMLVKAPELIKHEVIPQGEGKKPRILITASGPELRAFIAKHADDATMWVNDTTVVPTGAKREMTIAPEKSAFRFFKKG